MHDATAMQYASSAGYFCGSTKSEERQDSQDDDHSAYDVHDIIHEVTSY